jgi:TonB-dependent receptor
MDILAAALVRFGAACVSGVSLLLRMVLALTPPSRVVAGTLCCAVAATTLLAAVAAEEQKQSYRFPRGEAAAILAQFATESNRPILFLMDAVRGVQTNALAGSFTPHEALDRLLAGTALVAVHDPKSGGFIVNRRPAPFPPGHQGGEATRSPTTAVPRNDPPRPQPIAPMKNRTLIALLAGWLAIGHAGHAQLPAPGTITGRIFNPSTSEYLRNAQVRVVESGRTTTSEGGGEYRFSPVAPGPVTLTVTYTGYRTATATVTVAPGATVTQDFDLVSTLDAAPGRSGETIKLEAFVISSDREGAAKAIMDQRNSMNITNTVASDTFGDNPEGNVGEFLKHLPGVELDLFYGEVRSVRLGGLTSDYTSVTMDGIALASVDAGNSGRAFTMEMASLNSMESIEVSKTISADVDANAPGGIINLRTKRAFDRAGRRVSWQANVTAHSEAFSFSKSRGPDENAMNLKIRPGGIFEYSEVFFNKTLGVVLNVSESNVYQEAASVGVSYNATPTAADPRPLVPTSLNFEWDPRFNKRFATTLTVDYKINRDLNVGVGVVYNYVDLWAPQRILTFNAGTRTNVVGADPLLSFTSGANGNVQVNPVAVAKMGETFTLLPRFGYKRGDLEIEGKFAYSDSTSWYDPLGRRNSVRDTNSPTASNITFRAQRSSLMAPDWKIVQVAGPDISSGASYTNPNATINDGRFGRSVLFTGEVTGTLKSTTALPVTWKSGLKTRRQIQKFEDDQLTKRFDYIGASSPGAWAALNSPWPYEIDMLGGSIAAANGAGIFMPDLSAIGDLYRTNPAAFRQNWGTNADNFYQSYVARRRRYYEQIDAAFLMGTANINRLTLRGGVRWEETSTEASEADTRTPSEVRAAGFPVSAAGIATTIPGIEYQFLSRPRVKRSGGYDNLFPSASAKLQLARNFDAHLGYSTTIRRPSYSTVAGVWVVNETARTVTAPNPRLKPETADNYAARLAYYFEPVGQLAVTFTQRGVKNLFISDRLSAQEFGYAGNDELASYEFVTTENGTGKNRIRSMEWEYNQSLSFLGRLFKRLSVRGSYTRLYADTALANLTPHLASGGLNYTLNRLNLYANWNWTDDTNSNAAGSGFRRHRANVDAGGGWRLNQTYSLSWSARNVLNTPYLSMQRFPSGPTVLSRLQTVGVSWTFAIKGTY